MNAARRLLVLQMCRMGDILQTGPMLRGLKREYPQAELTLVVLDGFAATPIPPHLYDRLVRFPLIPLAAGLVPGKDWRQALERLREFLRELGPEPFDLAVNLTQTPQSALLMALVPAVQRRGPFQRPDRRSVVLGGWTQHFWSTVRSRSLACFNLVDIFRWIAGVGCDGQGLEYWIPRAAEARVAAWLAEQGLADRPLIAVQLGASEEAKRWPAERFAAALDQLPAEWGEVVLVGTPAEHPLAERFIAAARRPVYDAIGATKLTELGALIRRCRLLVTNDTGTMHVAAAVGTRVVNICTGSVFVQETGPYGLGHLVLEPDIACFPCTAGAKCHHHACRERLTAEDVAAAARFALGEGELPCPKGGRVLMARRTASGRLEHWPVDPSRVTAADLVRKCLSRVWEETVPAPAPVCETTPDPIPLAALEGGQRQELVESLRAMAAGLDEAKRVAADAAAMLRSLPGARSSQRQQLAARVHENLRQLIALSKMEKACHPFVDALMIEIDAIPTLDLRELADGQVAAYGRAATRAGRLAALLRETAAAHLAAG